MSSSGSKATLQRADTDELCGWGGMGNTVRSDSSTFDMAKLKEEVTADKEEIVVSKGANKNTATNAAASSTTTTTGGGAEISATMPGAAAQVLSAANTAAIAQMLLSDDEDDEGNKLGPNRGRGTTTVVVAASAGIDREVSDEDVLDSLNAERKATRKLLKGTKIWFESSLRDVVIINAKEIGFTQVRNEEDADIIWAEATHPHATLHFNTKMKPHQRCNFYPNFKQMASKCEFGRSINRLRNIYGDEDFEFVPRTFVYPGDRAVLAEHHKEQLALKKGKKGGPTYVVKPDGGCGGDGIYLTDDIANIKHSECVVQEYVTNPLLLGGIKFDLRVYVLVTSLEPLRFYVCREGLCRMAVSPYETPSKANYHKLNMHLTNYSLNKFSSDFIPNTNAHEDEECSKRSISTAFSQLRAEHGAEKFDEESLWEDINNMVEVVFTAIGPTILLHCGEHSSSSGSAAAGPSVVAASSSTSTTTAGGGNKQPRTRSPSSHCFQLVGFDVLIDDEMKPHLLEINHHPSLQTDAPIDMLVKSTVLRPLIRMVSYDVRKHKLAKRGKEISMEPAEWEEHFRGLFNEGGDGDTHRHMALPFLEIKDVFLETCTVGSKLTLEMNRTRLLKFARRMGWVQAGEGSVFKSSAEIDLLFIKRTNQTGLKVFEFFDFVTFIMEDVGSVLFPGDASALCTTRLHNMVGVLRSRPGL